MDSKDIEWEKAFRIVDEIDLAVSGLMAEARAAPRAQQRALLARKYRLTNSPEYLAALRYLEDPAAERERREVQHSIGGVALEKVFFDIPSEPSAFEPIEDSLEVFQTCCASQKFKPPSKQRKEPISVFHL